MAKATPFAKFARHGIQATIWENVLDDGRTAFNVSFERSWKDDSGHWHNSRSFRESDLPNLAAVANQAWTLIDRIRRHDNPPDTQVDCSPPELF